MRFLTLLILSTFLLASTEFNQLLKIPVLLEHYNEHKSEDGQISFWDYLFLHYATDHADNGDAEQDARLPFKSFQHTLQVFAARIAVAEIWNISSIFNGFIERVYGHFEDLRLFDQLLSSIWQPPKHLV